MLLHEDWLTTLAKRIEKTPHITHLKYGKNMPVKIDTEYVKDLLAGSGKSIEDFAHELNIHERGLYRTHFKAGLPEQEKKVHHFCKILDVDPHAILPLHDEPHMMALFQIDRRAYLRGKSKKDQRASSHRALWELTAPHQTWPMDADLNKFYQKSWITRFIKHQAKPEELPTPEGGYARFKLRMTTLPLPQVFHFAWRIEGGSELAWDYYGFVVVRNNCQFRISDKNTESIEIEVVDNEVYVETKFGSCSADFKIASMHDFDLVSWTWSDDSSSVLRFPMH